jgi:hypothetical protein
MNCDQPRFVEVQRSIEASSRTGETIELHEEHWRFFRTEAERVTDVRVVNLALKDVTESIMLLEEMQSRSNGNRQEQLHSNKKDLNSL